MGDAPGVRIDRWLLAARLFKTRGLAQQACAGGKVELNGARATAHKAVRIADRVRVTTPHGGRELVVLDLGERRLPASEAALLYQDRTPPSARRPEPSGAQDPWLAPAGSGRPSKRDRRRIDRLRGR